jgi:Cytochrome c7 and related cytochrome c
MAMPRLGHPTWFAVLAAVLVVVGTAARAEAQLGALVSPGPLSKAHASLDGLANCEKCHERGNRVSAARCLLCHKPIAARIARRTGIHRNVKDDCVQCHVEHAGVDGQLRPFDLATFDHARDAGFPLDGKHAALASKCETCHKTRSFVTASPTCSSCHSDPHKGALGATCERCHSTKVAFKDLTTAFDHSTTLFPLSGAHATVACARCHTTPTFKVAKFASCANCHQTPHASTVSTACTTCHTSASWKTSKFDHTRTAFPLVGKHSTVDCASCHKAPPMQAKPAAGTCATCHADPHKGEFTADCKSCHSEKGFTGAVFDHAGVTKFALADGHANVACERCHTGLRTKGVPLAGKVADFRGATTACASCHVDPHKAELGTACETCHTPRAFAVTTFTHQKARGLLAGAHSTLACEACHRPATGSGGATGTARALKPLAGIGRMATVGLASTPTACASCHRDPHLGQVGASCETCHTVSAPHFAPDLFNHDRTTFRLTGKHAGVECARCHKTETAAFPAGRGAAVRLAGISTGCATCHADVHLGQVSPTCATCHTTSSFTVKKYTHKKPPRDFFVGRHLGAECSSCHKTATADFPAGRGTAVRFQVGTQCVACHTDVHNGALGQNCAACHKPEPLRPAHTPASLDSRDPGVVP